MQHGSPPEPEADPLHTYSYMHMGGGAGGFAGGVASIYGSPPEGIPLHMEGGGAGGFAGGVEWGTTTTWGFLPEANGELQRQNSSQLREQAEAERRASDLAKAQTRQEAATTHKMMHELARTTQASMVQLQQQFQQAVEDAERELRLNPTIGLAGDLEDKRYFARLSQETGLTGWVDDTRIDRCESCAEQFPTGRHMPRNRETKVHCRACGWVVCNKCCPKNQTLPLTFWVSSEPNHPPRNVSEPKDKRVCGVCVIHQPLDRWRGAMRRVNDANAAIGRFIASLHSEMQRVADEEHASKLRREQELTEAQARRHEDAKVQQAELQRQAIYAIAELSRQAAA